MKKTLVLLGLALAVTLGFCGCGPSEEEVYEILGRVEQKQKKIKEANLSMDQGFQEKLDLLERQFTSANRAFSKGDYSATVKFLQEAESAADWIMNRGPLRAEADEKMRAASYAKSAADDPYMNAYRYAPETYQQAVQHVRQGSTAYENGNFEEAARSFRSAAASFRQAQAEAPKQMVRAMINSFVKVEAGSFNMGNNDHDGSRPVHRVTLSKDFYIGKYEVTQAQWQYVMGNNPSDHKGADRPVEEVSWNDAMAFCEKLNNYGYAPRGYKFTLPTEAQWEFAARGGNKSKGYTYSGSNDLKEVAWYSGNSYSEKHRDVGTKQPNELGLYDMSGNVYEWCLDIYGGYGYGDEKEVTDPQGPQDGSSRVCRGGCWRYGASSCRVANRDDHLLDCKHNDLGFRLALVPVQ